MRIAWRGMAALLACVCLYAICQVFPAFSAVPAPHEARYYQKLPGRKVQCQLCPRTCLIPDGKRGFCGVRENRGGTLYTLSFAKPVSMNAMDPIEKKPLFHFLPGTRTFSVATAGCNMQCKFCQNWEISQKKPEEVEYVYLEPAALVHRALASGVPTLAYTYSEPTIFFEYMLECAKLAKQAGLKNVMHSNGYVNPAPLKELAPYLDAANIDLKGFDNDFYAQVCSGTLAPVLESLKVLKENGVHVEITNLLLAGYNDNEGSLKKMCAWIKDNLGADTPLHFSRAFPMYKLTGINPTPIEALMRARAIAAEAGLRYVYIGNIGSDGAENTYCPRCKKAVIVRQGYFIAENDLAEGACKFCGQNIAGVWH